MHLPLAFPALGTLAASWALLVAARPLAMPQRGPSSPMGIGGRSDCKPNIFIFARGTGEPGLMVSPYDPPSTWAHGGSFWVSAY